MIYLRHKLLVVHLLMCGVVYSQNIGSKEHTYESIQKIYNETQKLIASNPDSAMLQIEEIRTISRELKYKRGLLKARLLEALILKRNNELDSASLILLEVASQAKSLSENTFEEARSRLELARIHHRLSNLNKAEENAMIAAEIFKSLDSVRYHSQALHNLAITNGMRGDYPKALEFFLKKKELLLDDSFSENQRLLAYSSLITNIGTVYSLMGDHEKSIAYSKEGLEIDFKLGDSVGAARSYLIIGKNFNAADQKDSAIYYYQLGVNFAINELDRDPRYAPLIYHGKQSIAAYLQDQNKYEEAISILRSSFKYRAENENYGIEDCYTMLGEFYQHLNQFDSALFFSRKAWVLAQNNKSKGNSRGAANRLASIFLKQKKLDSAYHYKELYHAYNDSIYNESNDKKFNKIRLELETLEKQSEIDDLTKQREIDKANRLMLIISIITLLIVAIAVVTILIYRHKNRQKKQKIRELQLNQSIEKKEVQLQQQTLHMINLNNSITEVEEKLKEVRKKNVVSGQDLQRVLSNITISKSMDKEWNQFESYFSNIHPEFSAKLLNYSEKITHQERRLAVLIKLDLSNREISNLLNIEPKSVSMNKYRLKKKLGLNDSDDLTLFIQKN